MKKYLTLSSWCVALQVSNRADGCAKLNITYFTFIPNNMNDYYDNT